MSLAIFSTISFLVLIYFCVKPKTLHTLELAAVIILVVYLDSNFTDIAMLNLKRINISEQPLDRFAFYFTFIILYPLVVALSIDWFQSLQSKVLKCLLLSFTVFIIVFLEQLSRYLEILHYKNWNWKLETIQWGIIWLLSYLMYRLFRKMVMKELKC